MRSRSCATAERGFTLLELIAALSIAALLACVVVAALAASTPDRRAEEAAGRIVQRLALVRASAMRAGAAQHAVVAAGPRGHLEVRFGERAAPFVAPALRLVDADGEAVHRVEVRFAPDGRTRSAPVRLLCDTDAPRCWRVAFDPVSGRPELEECDP